MKTTFLFALLLLSCSFATAQLSGTAFLSAQSNHANIKVKFIAVSGTAATDSCLTNAAGNYSINIAGGVYQMRFSCTGYQTQYYNNSAPQVLTNSTVLNPFSLQAGTAVYVNGSVSGFWTPGNVYYVQGNLTVPTGTSLVILPGTMVRFMGNYGLDALGTLSAIGNAGSPVLFTATDTNQVWDKIELHTSNSVTRYCIMEHCQEGVRINNASATVADCIMRKTRYSGIACIGSSSAPNITNNEIHHYGVHGIAYEGASTGTISCNHVYIGYYKSSQITQNSWGIRLSSGGLVANNHVHDGKIGLYCENNYSPVFKNNYVHNHSLAGIDVGSSLNPGPSPVVVNNVLVNNTTGFNQSAFVSGGAVFANNIVANCTTALNYFATFSCDHNLIYNCTNNFGSGMNTTGLGQTVSTNSNGDPVDSYFNLYMDPLFVNGQTPALQANSPALNAGNSSYNIHIGRVSYSCAGTPEPTGIKPHGSGPALDLKLYPNPGKGLYTIDLPAEMTLSVWDAAGKLLLCKHLDAGRQELNLEAYAPGLYVLTASNGQGYGAAKLVKE